MALFIPPKQVAPDPDPDLIPAVPVCPHALEEGETHCEVCSPILSIVPGWCEDEFCVVTQQLEQPISKHVVLARSCDTEQEYVNVQHQHFGEPYKLTKVVKGTPSGNVLITFWAGHLGEWLSCEVPQHYRLTTAPEYLARASRPPAQSPEARAARASHLAPYRKQRAELPPEPAQPTRCIVGQIGADKVLVDAGDGSVLERYPQAVGCKFDPQAEARKLGRLLVGQKDATTYALTMLRRAWADAKVQK